MNDRYSADEVFSRKLKAGKRTYIFDVRSTRNNDYYITVTERKQKPDGDGFMKQKLFVYKEDFLNFAEALKEVIDHVRTELLPDYDFENPETRHHAESEDGGSGGTYPRENRSSYDRPSYDRGSQDRPSYDRSRSNDRGRSYDRQPPRRDYGRKPKDQDYY